MQRRHCPRRDHRRGRDLPPTADPCPRPSPRSRRVLRRGRGRSPRRRQGERLCRRRANSAGQAALHLAKYAAQVTLLVRSGSLACDDLLPLADRAPVLLLDGREVGGRSLLRPWRCLLGHVAVLLSWTPAVMRRAGPADLIALAIGWCRGSPRAPLTSSPGETGLACRDAQARKPHARRHVRVSGAGIAASNRDDDTGDPVAHQRHDQAADGKTG